MNKSLILILICIALVTSCSTRQSANGSQGVVIANDTCKKIDDYLTQLEKEKNFSGGMLIIKDGKKVFCKGYGWANKEHKISFTPSTLTSMGSITKAFTAAAILKLAEQNKVSIYDSLKKFFPDVPADKANITLHQLLTHSSGFHEFLKDDGGDYERIGAKEFLKRVFTEPLAFNPGEKAVYTNVGMSILGIIIEQVAGIDYETYLKKSLFAPIGIQHLGYQYPNTLGDTIAIGYEKGNRWGTHLEHFEKAGGGPFWNLKANGGLEVSLNEMFLWANAITDHHLLNEESTAKMFTPHIQEEGQGSMYAFGYGCNISKSRLNTKMIDNGGSNGIYFARLIRLPEEGLIFYMVTNESSMNTNLILPNVTQLYFNGVIEQDALASGSVLEDKLSKQIYDILEKSTTTDLKAELKKEDLEVDDDMILLEVGQKLMMEKKLDKALMLYAYYTQTFPKIIVAWNDMGDVYRSQNNKAEAIRCYRQALKLRPGNPRAIKNLSELEK